MEICHQILEKIKAYDTIIIHRHMKPDPDALGSQMGLKYLLEKHFPDKHIKAVGFNEPTLTWLAKMDTVEDSDYQGALVIVCDTANTARIDDKRYDKGDYLIKIDHHPNDDQYGDLAWVDTNSSSASEMIALFAEATNLDLSDYAARLLMDTISFKIAKLQGYVYDHLEVDENGAARVTLTQEVLQAYNVTDAETAAIVGAPGRIDSVSLWGIFVEQADGHYRVRLRSKFVPINGVAKEHDGGGHPLASGANSYSLEENEQIYQELKNLVKNS